MDKLNPDMSMLEALDVLNEELILKGEEPVAFEHDCREGICGSCGFMINGVAHGPLRGHDGVPVDACAISKMAQELLSSHGARGVSVDQGSGGGSAARSTALSPPAGTSPFHRQRAGRQRDSGSQGRRRPRDGRGGLHRLRRVRGGVPQRVGGACSRAQRSRTSGCCRRASRSAIARAAHGGAGINRRFRQLHQHRRVRGGVSERDSARSDRADESRLSWRKFGWIAHNDEPRTTN